MRVSPVAIAWLARMSFIAALAGCGHRSTPDESFSHVSVYYRRGDQSPKIDFVGSRDAGPSIQMPEGTASALSLQFISQSQGILRGTLQSVDPGVLQVIPLSDGTGYGFLGAATGTTNVVVSVGGQTVQMVPASVSAPPASSLPPPIDAGALVALQNIDQNQPGASSSSPLDAGATDAGSGDAAPIDSSASAADASAAPSLGTDDETDGPLEDVASPDAPPGAAE